MEWSGARKMISRMADMTNRMPLKFVNVLGISLALCIAVWPAGAQQSQPSDAPASVAPSYTQVQGQPDNSAQPPADAQPPQGQPDQPPPMQGQAEARQP